MVADMALAAEPGYSPCDACGVSVISKPQIVTMKRANTLKFKSVIGVPAESMCIPHKSLDSTVQKGNVPSAARQAGACSIKLHPAKDRSLNRAPTDAWTGTPLV